MGKSWDWSAIYPQQLMSSSSAISYNPLSANEEKALLSTEHATKKQQDFYEGYESDPASAGFILCFILGLTSFFIATFALRTSSGGSSDPGVTSQLSLINVVLNSILNYTFSINVTVDDLNTIISSAFEGASFVDLATNSVIESTSSTIAQLIQDLIDLNEVCCSTTLAAVGGLKINDVIESFGGIAAAATN